MNPEDRERMENIRDQIIELKRKQKEEQEASRRALREQIGELMRQQEEAAHARSAELNRQISEILQNKQEEGEGRKRTIREQIAERVANAQEEHARYHRGVDRRLDVFQDQGDGDIRKGFLKLHILGILANGPSHGYEIMHNIGHHTGGMWRPSPGSLYPALEALESRGYITCQGDGRRKVYSLTPKGEETLAQIQKRREEMFLEMRAYLSDILGE